MAKELEDQHKSILDAITGHEEADESNSFANEDTFEVDDDNDDASQLEAKPEKNGKAQDDDDDNDVDDNRRDNRNQQDEEAGVSRHRTTEAVAATDERFRYRSDRHGNLLDKDGKILFSAGRSRAVFEKVKQIAYSESQKNAEIIASHQAISEASRELLQRYKSLKEEKALPQKHGLSELEVTEALDMRAQMKLDPKAGIRKILTMLHLSGTDLSDIGVNGPLDAKEVARHMLELQEAKQQQNKPKEPDPLDAAKQEATAFLQRHPTAKAHTGLVAEAKRRYPNMTLDEIWYQIQLHAQKSANADRRQPNNLGRTIPRNSNISQSAARTKKLSLKAVDPTKSFSQIGRDLLNDIRAIEER